MNAVINRISDDLYQITLPRPAEGFDDFIGVYLFTGKKTYLVDAGPSATVPALLGALDEIGVGRLDAILLTHIHIDHAGGVGPVSGRFPNAPVVCHKKAIPHLIEPSRLEEGSVKTLGALGRAYGPIPPTPADRLFDAETFSDGFVTPVLTPGHAPHHVSFFTPGYLFAGEAGGVCLDLGPAGEYMRPATPPRFFLNIAVDSIDTLISGEPDLICYGHFGVRANGADRLRNHKKQLYFWESVVRDVIRSEDGEDRVAAAVERLIATDPYMAAFGNMPEAMQERERGFLTNSVRGFVGYLTS